MQNKKKISTYELDASQLDQALAILKKELQVNSPSRRQRIIFTILKIAVSGFVVTCITFIPLIIFHKYIPEYIYTVNSVLLGFSFLMIPILFLLNLPLILKLRRQNKLARRLGLSDAFKVPWREQIKRKRKQIKRKMFGSITSILVSIFGILLIICVLIFGIFLLNLFWPLATIKDVIFFCCIFALFIGVGVIIIYTQFLKRRKERLEFISIALHRF